MQVMFFFSNWRKYITHPPRANTYHTYLYVTAIISIKSWLSLRACKLDMFVSSISSTIPIKLLLSPHQIISRRRARGRWAILVHRNWNSNCAGSSQRPIDRSCDTYCDVNHLNLFSRRLVLNLFYNWLVFASKHISSFSDESHNHQIHPNIV